MEDSGGTVEPSSYLGVRITRKSEHPLLSIISDSPRVRSIQRGWQTPRPANDSSLDFFLNDERGRRTEKFYVPPVKSPRLPPLKTRASLTGTLNGLTIDVSRPSDLCEIPEEVAAAITNPSSSKAPAREDDDDEDEDLEALLSPGSRNLNNEDEEEHDTGVFGESLTDDEDRKVESDNRKPARPPESPRVERSSWTTSGVTGLLLSALPSIPDVLNPFSSSPDDHVLLYPAEQCQADFPDFPDEQRKPSAVTASLPQSTDPFYSSPDLRLLDHQQPRTPGLPKTLSKDDSGLSHFPSLANDLRLKKKKTFHRCKTAPLLSGLSELHMKMEAKCQPTPKQSAANVVWQAFMGLCIYLAVGVIIYTWKRTEFSGIETVGVVDALYFCIVTMCSIGYGDITPVTSSAKMLSCALVLVGFGFIGALLSGMVTFVLDHQEHVLLNLVGDGHHERAKKYVMDSKKGRMRIRMKVALAVGTVVMTMTVGVLFLHYFENLKWIDAVYVTCISITTVGYGDYSFQTMWGRLFAAGWLLLSTLGVARAFLFLAEARVHRRHRHLARRVLHRKMTADDLLAMDLHNDGHVGKSEFVVYKLKEMGRVEQQDVEEICNEFDAIDTLNLGKITLGQLLHGDS